MHRKTAANARTNNINMNTDLITIQEFDDATPRQSSEDAREAFLKERIDSWDFAHLDTRIQNICREEGIITVADLMKRSERDLLWLPNCGRKSVNMLKLLLTDHGLSLSERWKPPKLQTMAELQPIPDPYNWVDIAINKQLGP
jgi:DNA-directed RNA polymerase subunit alpha